MSDNVKVVIKKLGRFRVNNKQVDGLADAETKTIYIDSRTNRKYHLELYIHEAMHLLNWDWPEEKIKHQSKVLANGIWKMKYRKVEL